MSQDRCEWTTKDTVPSKGYRYSSCGQKGSPTTPFPDQFELCPFCGKLVLHVPWALIEAEIESLNRDEFEAQKENMRRSELTRLAREKEDRKTRGFTSQSPGLSTACTAEILSHDWRVVLGTDDVFSCPRCQALTIARVDDRSTCVHQWMYAHPVGYERTCTKCHVGEQVEPDGGVVKEVLEHRDEIGVGALVVIREKGHNGAMFVDFASWDRARLNEQLERVTENMNTAMANSFAPLIGSPPVTVEPDISDVFSGQAYHDYWGQKVD